jgi:hypothetical protein
MNDSLLELHSFYRMGYIIFPHTVAEIPYPRCTLMYQSQPLMCLVMDCKLQA